MLRGVNMDCERRNKEMQEELERAWEENKVQQAAVSTFIKKLNS